MPTEGLWRISGSRRCVHETLKRYRGIFSDIKPSSPWNADSDEDFLCHLGAIARGRDSLMNPTKTGLLAFGYECEITRYLPQYLLDCREETSAKNRWVDRICSQAGDWSGNIIDFYLGVTESVNEAVANTVTHAHYGSSAMVKVILRADSLGVENTSGFLIDWEVATAGGFSEARNPTLARMLSLVGATDRAGSGLQKIWSVWEGLLGTAPELEEAHAPASVRLVLPLDNRLWTLPEAAISDQERAVLECVLASDTGIFAAEVSSELGISERVAQKVLRNLVNKGLAERTREGRSFRYAVR